MVILRVYRGVADHFPIHVSEWLMLWPAFGLWVALQTSPNMFQTSPSFAYRADWADEGTWSAIIGLCGIARLTALTINGTFKSFAFSRNIRAGASIIGVLIWSQISLGFFMAFVNAGGAASGVVAWYAMVLLELVNSYRSWSDVGKNAAGRE